MFHLYHKVWPLQNTPRRSCPACSSARPAGWSCVRAVHACVWNAGAAVVLLHALTFAYDGGWDKALLQCFNLGVAHDVSVPQVDCTTTSTMAANPARFWLFSTAATLAPY